MTRHWVPNSATLRLGGGIMLGLGGMLLLGVGLGTALDYMIAQSHPVDLPAALLLKAEYTIAGLLFLIVGVGTVRKTLDNGGMSG